MSNVPIPPTFADPIIADKAAGRTYFNPVWIKWFLDFAQILQTLPNTTNHEGLAGLLGGTTNEHYHFTNAEHAALVGFVAAIPGRLLGIQVISATQVYTPTAGTASIYYKLAGGGGAGGGSQATGVGQFAVGAGGGSGGYVESRLTTGFSGATMTIGLGGIASSGGAGGNGGNSTFGIATAGGGTGGTVGTATATLIGAAGNGPGGTATGGTILNVPGMPGYVGLLLNSLCLGGRGGSSAFGAGGVESVAAAGSAATGPGAGGGGSGNLASSAARAGGAGLPGLGIIYEYA